MIELPGYTIAERTYEGSETVVYRGRRDADGAPVAVKVTRNDYPTAKELARLRREFALLQDISAVPGVVRPYDLTKYGRGLALVMEDLGRCSLAALLEARRLDVPIALKIAVDLTNTLASLHELRVVHKDIKPHNVLVDERTLAPRLVDFGISTRLSRELGRASAPDSLEGTLTYMAPEQTGRMNRAVDLRADLYSLGVTLYEMLLGAPPFSAADPTELIHCHIARPAVAPHEQEPAVPAMLSGIVMRLLAKTPEERYQSARGLAADLKECLRQWEATGTIDAFPMGRHDRPTTLRIPQKLYGREQEVRALLSAFARARQGSRELVLVSGDAGVGKSALVSEIHKTIAEQGGYFVLGKVDQIGRDAPLSAVARAFRDLIRQICTESAVALDAWKEKLSAAVGPNGRLLVELCPELELILGFQPAPAAVGPSEAKNRFGLLVHRFLCAFTAPERPLVIFLDDLQWADPASLRLLSSILSDPETTHLLIVGAYRDNEVDAAHPLRLTLSALRNAGTPITEITLPPLAPATVTQIVADTLSARAQDVEAFAALAFTKTHGNPFFLAQFLWTLYDDGLLCLDASSGEWSWDMARVREAEVTDNVADLLTGKLHRLPAATRRVLRLAACIGDEFDLGTLSEIGEAPRDRIGADLWPALREGLILPLDGNYLFLDESAGMTPEAGDISASYRFLHDRVWEAAYGLIDPERRREVHLGIGRLLLRRSRGEPRDEELATVVRHLNLGAALLTDQAERDGLARQNLRAGRMAKDRAAYQAAAGYFTLGKELTSDAAWERDAELCFALHIEGAEALYLSGEDERAEALFDILLSRSTSPVKRARVHNLRLILYTTRAKHADAVKAGIEGLAVLGVTLPETAAEQQAAFGAGLAEAAANLGKRRIEDLINAPVESDPERKAAMQLLSDLKRPAYIANPGLHASLALKVVNHSLTYGQSELSAFAYVSYGFMLAALLGRHAEGHAFGKLALAVNEKFGSTALVAQVNVVFATYLYLCEPLRAAIPYVDSARKAALESGDFLWLSATCSVLPLKLGAGYQLEELREETAQGLAVMRRTKDVTAAAVLTLIRQTIACLEGRTESRVSLGDDTCAEAELLPKLEETKHGIVFFHFHLYKLQIFYLYGDHAGAAAAAEASERYMASVRGLYVTTLVPFYACLALLALPQAQSPEEAQRREEAIARSRARMAELSAIAPSNFYNKLLLLDAEAARAAGRSDEALGLYERAIALAKQNDFPHEEALANERCATMYMGMGRPKAARGYLLDAYLGYLHWGATAKAEDLAKEYEPHFSALSSGAKRATSSVSSTTKGTTLLNRTTMSGMRDAALVVRAVQDIAGEIELSKIIDRLVKIVLENAGAQRGALLLLRDGRLFVEARFSADPWSLELGPSAPLDASHDLPHGPLHFVTRARESMVVDDAGSDDRVRADPYVSSSGVRSMLCLPLLHRGQVSGVLYLENRSASAVFGQIRVQLLALLSSQAAIAIQHSQLVASVQRVNERLEAEVAQRTLDLRASNAELATTNERLELELVQREQAELGRASLQQQMFEAQRERMAELSTPLIPITDEIMVMPLIGTMDEERAKQVLEVALEGAHRHGARIVILDITGMRHIDTRVIGTLVNTATALRLLGAEAVLSGIRAEVAQAMVRLETNLGTIVTKGTLQAAIAYAFPSIQPTRERVASL